MYGKASQPYEVQRLALMALIGLLAACGGKGPAYSQAELDAALGTEAAARTQTAQNSAGTAEPQSATATPDETATPTIKTTPTPGSTDPHGDGVFTVGVDISPGLWRVIPSDRNGFCYWARRKYDGVILGSYYGIPGGEVLIRSTDYEVEFDGCGEWVFMGER